MKINEFCSVVALTVACCISFVGPSMAQDLETRSTFVRPGRRIPGVLYQPVKPVAESRIGILVMHTAADYLDFSPGPELSRRGYTVLCANNSTDNYEEKVLAVKAGVEYLLNYPGIKKIVLFGHSGGSGLMTTYQNIAENGLKACQGPEKISRCSDQLAGLPPADGMMLIDPNWGDGAMMLFSLDPAVINEETELSLNPELDLFNPENGFTPQGATYSDAFIRYFQSEQGKRNNQLIATAQKRLEDITAGKGRFSDDEPFIVPGADSSMFNNKLYPQDIRLMSHTQKAWPLLRSDGSVVTEVVHSVRGAKNLQGNSTPTLGGALNTTVRTFLNTYALRVGEDYGYDEDGVRGIDWSSSYTCPPGNVKGVTVPLLTMGMTGSWEYLSVETIYENAKSADKSIAFVEGASHLYETCRECEQRPGQFGDTRKTLFDYIDKWLSKKGRFLQNRLDR